MARLGSLIAFYRWKFNGKSTATANCLRFVRPFVANFERTFAITHHAWTARYSRALVQALFSVAQLIHSKNRKRNRFKCWQTVDRPAPKFLITFDSTSARSTQWMLTAMDGSFNRNLTSEPLSSSCGSSRYPFDSYLCVSATRRRAMGMSSSSRSHLLYPFNDAFLFSLCIYWFGRGEKERERGGRREGERQRERGREGKMGGGSQFHRERTDFE